MKKKFPRMEVIEKQIAVVAEVDPEAISEEDLEKIQGGSVAAAAANITRQMYIMYGVPRPPFLRNLLGGGKDNNGPQNA
jgi:hypothetical protein